MLKFLRAFAIAFIALCLTCSPIYAQQSKPAHARAGHRRPPHPMPRVNYTLSVASAVPFGNQNYDLGWLRGTVQGQIGYRLDNLTKIQASFFQMPSALVGLNGTAPFYIKGVTRAIRTVQLRPTNPAAVYRIGSITLSRTFFIHKQPFVLTPGYLFSYDEYDDSLTVNDSGAPATVKARTFEDEFLALSTPLVRTPKLLVLATAQVQRLVHTAGLNVTNNPQFQDVLYAEYFANRHTSFFGQASSANTYNETDPYPEHDFAYSYGINYRLRKPFFVQALVSTINPTNYPTNGVANLTCLDPPRCSVVVPTIGSYKTSAAIFAIGIGDPMVPPL